MLAGISRGLSTDEIAALQCISPHTTRTHVKNAMRKLGARTRAHAVALALDAGWIDTRR